MRKNFYRLVALVSLMIVGCTSVPKTDSSQTRIQIQNPREIIFIHGMFMTPKSWQNWEAYFQKLGYKTSAPAWPLHDLPVTEQRQAAHLRKLESLELAQVVDSYRQILKAKAHKPILIGHSMGGLIAQILLSEGLAEAAIAIDSAPANGIFVLNWSFLKSNWGAISPFASLEKPIELDVEDFQYAFANQQDPSQVPRIYNEHYVPESRRVGKGPTKEIANIDLTQKRGPLLLIAGSEDHIIPARLNYKNFELYKKSPAYTEFKLFEGRDHWLIAGAGWEEIASFTSEWLTKRY